MILVPDINYGTLSSVTRMLERAEVEFFVSSNPEDIKLASKVILVGVGSFDEYVFALRQAKFFDPLKELALNSSVPLMGICVGMHVLFQGSEEGTQNGFGVFKEKISRFNESKNFRVPHMGWNKIKMIQSPSNIDMFSPLQETLQKFYFVHSYRSINLPDNEVLFKTKYAGDIFNSGVIRGTTIGLQFHPEKSHAFGMNLFRVFSKIKNNV
jgi:glutamine amidotransferase